MTSGGMLQSRPSTAMREDERRAMLDDGDDSRVEQACARQFVSPDGAVLGVAALDAHRQVLEMAATIEILSRDFASQQQELLRAYERIRELSGREANHGDDSAGVAVPSSRAFKDAEDSGRDRDGRCCAHQEELVGMRELLVVKDTALTAALQQRNEYRVKLERAEALVRDLRATHFDGSGGETRVGWKVHPTPSSFAGYHATGVVVPSTSGYLSSASSGSTSSVLLGGSGGGVIEVPRNERFDHESTYQRKENDELFWRKQYKEAVRMRKKYGPANPATTATATAGHLHGAGPTAARPSLKIFSFPDNRRQKGIKDENVPFSRYIGISARQHEIIKEQHRMLA
ncbi:hypothetical protein PybrP1_012128 [[Pythium] brassicae (nom. inval.)]|nr:hypothetical protein PybrP1_012128 [[Pythium] brassicae (nom. inval.)]